MNFFKNAALLSLIMMLISCASDQHFYTGPHLQTDQLATIYGNNIDIEKINGVNSDIGYFVRLAYAKPGPSEIDIYCSNRVINTTFHVNITLSMNLLAGGVYYIDSAEGDCGQFRAFYLGKNYSFLSEDEYLGFNFYEIRDRIESDGQRIFYLDRYK